MKRGKNLREHDLRLLNFKKPKEIINESFISNTFNLFEKDLASFYS